MRAIRIPVRTTKGLGVAVSALFLVFLTAPFAAAWADNTCAYGFSSGKGSSYWSFCVTQNGNIPSLVMPAGIQLIGPDSEGYGICTGNAGQTGDYSDYGVSDTGNWGPSTLVSKTANSVKIARTTSDGNWTLTQTITQNAHTPSITVIMALTNNQPTAEFASLLRFAEAQPPNAANNSLSISGFYGVATWALPYPVTEPEYGLKLENTGFPTQFQTALYPIVQTVVTGPDPCKSGANVSDGLWGSALGESLGSLELVYVGAIGAHMTSTATLIYSEL